MTLALGDLHKLSHAEAGFAHNGDSEEGASLLQAAPASPSAPQPKPASLAAQRETSSSLVWGLLLYAACTVCSSGMSILAKLAHSRGIPVMQIVLVRSAMVRSFDTPANLSDWTSMNIVTACAQCHAHGIMLTSAEAA
jgi:cytochrome c553